MKTFNLHNHTTFSDGSCPPEKIHSIVDADIFAVTDHNCMLFYKTLKKRKEPFKLISGIELSVLYEMKDVSYKHMFAHTLVLGYDIAKAQEVNLGISDDYAIKKLGKNNGTDNIITIDSLKEKVSYCGGKIILVHPFNGVFHPDATEYILDLFKDFDLDGFEALHPSLDKAQSLAILDYCRKNNKIASGGTDNHYSITEELSNFNLVKEYIDCFQWIYDIDGVV